MNNPSETREFKILACFLLILNLCFVFYYYMQKDGFHVDEMWSYAHANSSQTAYLHPDIDSYWHEKDILKLYNQWLDGKVFHDYLTVQPKEQFSYGHIKDNLQVVEHPPLYFVILHTVCSFFPEKFNKWYGFGLNVAIYMLVLIMMYKLSMIILKDKVNALLPVVFYAFSEAGFATVLFIRMYALQTLFATCLIYETVKLIKQNKADNWQMLRILLYSLLGMLTQYSSIVFSFISASIVCFILLQRKNYRLLIKYAMSMLISVILLFIIFPTAYSVLLYSYRGNNVLQSLNSIQISSQAASNYGVIYYLWRAEIFFHSLLNVYFSQFFSFENFPDTLWVLLILTCSIFVLTYKKRETATNVLFLVSLIMGLFLRKFMPQMQDFGLRYYMLIMPMVSILTIYGFNVLMQKCHISSKLANVIIILVIITNAIHTDFGHRSAFRFIYGNTSKRLAADIKDKDIIIYIEPKHFIYSLAPLLKDSHRFYYSKKSCTTEAIKNVINASETYILYERKYEASRNNELPQTRQILCKKLDNMLDFKYTARSGEKSYDVYKLKQEYPNHH